MMDQKKSNWARIGGLVCVVGLVLVGFTSAQTPSETPTQTSETQQSATAPDQTGSVPDGGCVVLGNKVFRPDGTVTESGRIVRDATSLMRSVHVTPSIDIKRVLSQQAKLLSDNLPEGKRIWFESNLADKGFDPKQMAYEYNGTRTLAKTGNGFTHHVDSQERKTALLKDLKDRNWPTPFKVKSPGQPATIVDQHYESSSTSATNRKVRFVPTKGPVKFDRSIRIDGIGLKSPLFPNNREVSLTKLPDELEAIYEFEVFQGRKTEMKKLLDQVIHKNSVKRTGGIEIPRVGMLGLDENSWGNGTKNSEELLRGLLAKKSYGFKRVFKQVARTPNSNSSVRLASDEEFAFKGKQFKQGVESDFTKDYSVGSSIQISPMLKGTNLSSVIQMDNISLTSVLREHVHPSYSDNGDWREHPYMGISNDLQAVTVPVGSRFLVWATGTFQDSSAKKLAQDDALIVLVRPKLIRRVAETYIAKAKPIPTVVEGKLELPQQAGHARSKLRKAPVAPASHVEEFNSDKKVISPVKFQSLPESTMVQYNVLVFEVLNKELEGLLERTKNALPKSEQPKNGNQSLTIGKSDSKSYMDLSKELKTLSKGKKAKVISNPRIISLLNLTGRVTIGQKVSRAGGFENGVFTNIEQVQVGHTVEITGRGFTKSGDFISVLDTLSTRLDKENSIIIGVDSKGHYIKTPQIVETEMNTTLSTKADQTAVVKGTSHMEDGKVWTNLLLITPSLVK